ncbi:hypothetical protein K2173_021456 [Erythroxylum novogranatense]|uniref:Protein kinase domain-containing protein n=1 Tax=Erythroxylum novogranatense TaxID=1862640 RepID=A0AAV8TXN7_9ROSI|nr:hypothetical protein K2173_021456 [Erythroxylum novogranatense]
MSFFLFLFYAHLAASQALAASYLLPNDAVHLLSFKSKADLDNKLLYSLNEPFDYCQWQGVKCAQARVVRLVLQNFALRGTFSPDTLSNLDQLRVLSLRNNSLSGPIPDLSLLLNLKSLFLGHNSFSGSFPLSVLSLHRLTVLDLSFNHLSGSIPTRLSLLDRASSIRLNSNRFNGSVPPLNQTLLVVFNVSDNNLTGQIPVTPTLSRFDASSFRSNIGLCGEIINKVCTTRSPFFSPSSGNANSPTAPLSQSAEAQDGGVMVGSPPSRAKHKRTRIIFGIVGVSVLVTFLVCAFFALVKKQKGGTSSSEKRLQEIVSTPGPAAVEPDDGATVAKTAQREAQLRTAAKSGRLVFCSVEHEAAPYTLEQLMRASAELLGRGTIGTTYKAVLDNRLIVTVKRLDSIKTATTSSEAFEVHMDAVGSLRHPNLVPMMAYFQAKGERLIIYHYQPNGSLFNLIHGSRSSRAKPLHWTSCLKIAEDVAQGLAYIHQARKLVHGNLKSSNVVLGADFEACITDYCLAILADTSLSEDPDSAACRAPETRKSNRRATYKSDVYAFGILLLELISGKHPSQHPYLVPADMLDWVRAVREGDGAEDNQLGMLAEVASVCSLTSPEQRPAMWQVLKMIQQIKESAMTEDSAAPGYP